MHRIAPPLPTCTTNPCLLAWSGGGRHQYHSKERRLPYKADMYLLLRYVRKLSSIYKPSFLRIQIEVKKNSCTKRPASCYLGMYYTLDILVTWYLHMHDNVCSMNLRFLFMTDPNYLPYIFYFLSHANS